MNIRTATMEDLSTIVRIEVTCFPKAEAADEESFRKRLETFSECFWLLEENGEIIGFVNGMVTDCADLMDEMYEDASMHDKNGEWQMVFGLDVIPEYRKQGCAAMLMKHLLENAEAQGRKGVVLTCKEKLIHYYEKFGFQNEGISKSIHGNVVWYQMRKVLTNEQ